MKHFMKNNNFFASECQFVSLENRTLKQQKQREREREKERERERGRERITFVKRNKFVLLTVH